MQTERGGTAAQRMAQKYSGLLPVDASPVSFARWLERLGVTIDDPDEYTDMYLTACELAGFDDGVPYDIPEAPAPAIAKPAPRLPALGAQEAATEFLAWVRMTGRCGRYGSDGLAALYAEHAAEIGHAETPVNTLRAVLITLPGVGRRMADVKVKGNRSERRLRSMEWSLLAEPAHVEPVRIAA